MNYHCNLLFIHQVTDNKYQRTVHTWRWANKYASWLDIKLWTQNKQLRTNNKKSRLVVFCKDSRVKSIIVLYIKKSKKLFKINLFKSKLTITLPFIVYNYIWYIIFDMTGQ